MNAILIAGIIQSGFLSLLLFNKKQKSSSDLFLAIWLLFIGIHLCFFYVHFNELNYKYPHLLGVDAFFPMLQGPFLYVYTLMLTSKKNVFKKIYLLHALPFVLVMTYGIFDFYLQPGEIKIQMLKQMETHMPPIYAFGFFHVMSNGIIYVILSLLKLRKHKKNIADNFSYTEEINLSWLRYVLIGMGVVWTTVLVAGVKLLLNLPDNFDDYAIAASIVFAVFFMGYFGFKQHTIYTDVSVESARQAMKHHAEQERKLSTPPKIESYKQQAERYKRSGLKHMNTDSYLSKVFNYIENEKPYLNNKLSLTMLAKELNMSNNHLSQILNERLNKNFFDFINEYRINEVKEKITDPKFKDYTLLAIAYESGFNSKSSFNSIFKKYTNLTPSEFQKSLQKHA